MHETILSGTWKKILFVMFISGSILLTVSYYDYSKLQKYQMLVTTRISKENVSMDKNRTEDASLGSSQESPNDWQPDSIVENDRYLVSSSKCKIINLDPFSKDAKKYYKAQKYKFCTKKDLLTYVTKEDNIATVHIDSDIIPQYTKSQITCCYSDVWRNNDSIKDPDDSIKLAPCKDFQNNVTINKEAILIKCTEEGSKKKIYENVHTSVRITKDVQKKLRNYDNSTTNKPINVLFVGIDSISRLNFIRAMPDTYRFVEDNGWISLKGYNKMDDNTFPNLMAILTGYNQSTAYKICNPQDLGFLDKCPMLWYRYRDLGYVTAYAEDAGDLSTFNYEKKGFKTPPADYYFRPYILATEKLTTVTVSSMEYCTGPETAGERIMNIAKEFTTTFKDYPHFGFFWMNTFSHNDINTPSMMDNKVKKFLVDLKTSGITNNSLILFISDHGMRFGDIRLTNTGWLEERLPYIYFSFPPWFQDKFPREYNNFKKNANKLTTPYDVHMTLQQVLTMSGLNHTIKPGDACPQCMSLFEQVPEERSCEDAGITDHWCTCAGYSETKLAKAAEKRIADFMLEFINKIVSEKTSGKCAKFTYDTINTRISETYSYKNTSQLLVVLKTHPKAVFETTISFDGDVMTSELHARDVSRLDYYNWVSHCVSGWYLKKYCYCK